MEILDAMPGNRGETPASAPGATRAADGHNGEPAVEVEVSPNMTRAELMRLLISLDEAGATRVRLVTRW